MKLDAIVVGGNFGGLSAAMQLARARRSVAVIDAGSPRNRFSIASHGVLGQDGKNYAAILEVCMQQLSAYPTVKFVKDEVKTACKSHDSFVLTLAGGGEMESARLVLATGVVDELPLIPGLKERWGITVLHCPYCHGYEISEYPIGVLASHPMSAHQAILLSDWGKTILFTQGNIEPNPEEKGLLAKRNVEIEQTPIIKITGEAPRIENVVLEGGRKVKVGALFITPGLRMGSSLAEQLGCDFEEGPLGRYIQVDDWKQTSVKGVFAAGDIVLPIHNATLASAAGVIAGVGAHQSLVF